MTSAHSHYSSIVVSFIAGLLLGSFTIWVFLTPDQKNITPYTMTVSPLESSTNIYPPSNTSNYESKVHTQPTPLNLSIPTVNIDTVFTEPLGLNNDNSVAVPDNYEKVGWYKYGPTPGELGPAVILGHVDSFEGPAVFFNLKQVSIGDEIFIARDDNTTAVFTVTETEDLRQSEFPTNKVYGDIGYPGLRLITCTGVFSHTTQRYSHNLIIYAELSRFE